MCHLIESIMSESIYSLDGHYYLTLEREEQQNMGAYDKNKSVIHCEFL